MSSLAYLSDKQYAYWHTADRKQHCAIRRRGYRGAFPWIYTAPSGNEVIMRTSQVADAMSIDPNSYGL